MRGRDIAVDAAASALVPVVVFLIPFHDIVSANVRELLYHRGLALALLVAGVACWAIGFLVVRKWPQRSVARLWVTVPWAILVLDVAGAALERRDIALAVMAAVDAAIIAAVVVAAMKAPWPRLRAIAAAAAAVLFIQGAVAHAAFLRTLPPELIAGATPVAETASVATPADSVPGNVYHILLDAYHSEAFAFSAGATAAQRYPGFTYYTRFNSNFPHTSSSEPALIHGRFPTEGMSIDDWPSLAVREGFWADLRAAGIDVWLYPYGRDSCLDGAARCVTSTDLEGVAGSTITRDATIDLWVLRLIPASVRVWLAPSGEDEGTAGVSAVAAVRRLVGAGGVPTAPGGVRTLPIQYYNLQLFDELLADEAARPARGQYVYWHGLIPHHDYLLNERCEPNPDPKYDIPHYWGFVGCANVMIDRLVQRLRELGRLESSLIIVHGDHGDPNFLTGPEWMGGRPELTLDPIARTYQPLDRSYTIGYEEKIMLGDSSAWRSIAVEILSSALLLVKTPGATQYVEETRPVQLMDIAPTVLSHFGVPTASYDGVPFSRVPENRQPIFFAHHRNFNGKFSRYQLRSDGWHFVADLPVRD